MKHYIYFLLLITLSLSSCSRTEENFDNYLVMDTAALNQKILAANSVNREPLNIALFLFGAGSEAHTQELSLQSLNKGEVLREVKVTLTMEGLLDDSVDGEKYVLFLKRGDDNQWKIIKCYHAFKCQQGRGHQSYSKEKCS